MTKAKRGDLVVIERKTSYITTSEGYKESVEYEVGVVSSITREGCIKAFRGRYESPTISNTFGYLRSPGYPGKPFDSLEEVKNTLRPFAVAA